MDYIYEIRELFSVFISRDRTKTLLDCSVAQKNTCKLLSSM
jgi:hypothetical protein